LDDTASFAAPLIFENTALTAAQLSVNATVPRDGVYYWRVCARPTPTTCGAWSTPEEIVADAP
jgi:hypothetical protein